MWQLRATALGALQLQPEQYWRLTYAELVEMLQGARDRERNRWERLAWQTAHLLNVAGKSLKRDVQPLDLLGRGKERRSDLDRRYREDQEAERLLREQGA